MGLKMGLKTKSYYSNNPLKPCGAPNTIRTYDLRLKGNTNLSHTDHFNQTTLQTL